MNKPLIVVTGATGKTGIPVVEQLIERGFPVRAVARRHDERSEKLSSLGAEVVLGDFLDVESMRAALAGAGRVYFCYPPDDGLLEATANIAVAAREHGVQGLVNMSQITALDGARSPLSHQHWLSENILDWAGIGASHIRPTFFAEDLYLFTGTSTADDGVLLLPFGKGRHAPVTAEDIARVVTAMLIDSAAYIGQRIDITGPRILTMDEAADVIGRQLGRPVEYVDVPVERWRGALVQRPEFSEFLAKHLAAVAVDHQNGRFDRQTDAVERIGGRAPQTLEEFVVARADVFRGLEPVPAQRRTA